MWLVALPARRNAAQSAPEKQLQGLYPVAYSAAMMDGCGHPHERPNYWSRHGRTRVKHKIIGYTIGAILVAACGRPAASTDSPFHPASGRARYTLG